MNAINFDNISNVVLINEDWAMKMVAIQCTLASQSYPEGATSIIIAQRQGFGTTADEVLNLLASPEDMVRTHFLEALSQSDIYSYYLAGHTVEKDGGCNDRDRKPDSNAKYYETKLTIIHPASEAHIAKYSKKRTIERSIVCLQTIYTN